MGQLLSDFETLGAECAAGINMHQGEEEGSGQWGALPCFRAVLMSSSWAPGRSQVTCKGEELCFACSTTNLCPQRCPGLRS